MKKVSITESKLRGIVRKMLIEQPIQPANPQQQSADLQAATELKNVMRLPISQFVDKFSTIASDNKVLNVLKRGLQDGNPTDDVVSYTQGSTSVSKLIPTQNEIGMDESLKNILTDKYGSLGSFLQGKANVGPNPIVIYNGKYIIDGHHRWSQVFAANPKAVVPILNLVGKLPAMDILKIVHLSIATGANKLPLSSAKGTNLLLVGENDVRNYVLQNLDNKALAVWQRSGFKDANAVAQHIVNNVKLLQRNGVAKGAPPRTKMPQTDAVEDSNTVINRIAKGIVNFNQPEAGLQESTTYNKRNRMKKISITESDLRRMVRNMLMEQTPGAINTGIETRFDTDTSKLPTYQRLLQSVKTQRASLDGIFKSILSDMVNINMSKADIVTALKVALQEMSPNSNKIIGSNAQKSSQPQPTQTTMGASSGMPTKLGESRNRKKF